MSDQTVTITAEIKVRYICQNSEEIADAVQSIREVVDTLRQNGEATGTLQVESVGPIEI